MRVWFDPVRRELTADPRGVGLDSEGALVARTKVRVVSTTATLADTDELLLVDTTAGAVTVTLPALTGRKGRRFTVKSVGVNPVYILGAGSDTIEGTTRISLFEKGESVEIVGDTVGSTWQTRGWRVDRFDLRRYGVVANSQAADDTAYNLAAVTQALTDAAVYGGKVTVPIASTGPLYFAPAGATLSAALGGQLTIVETILSTDAAPFDLTVGSTAALPTSGTLLVRSDTPASTPPEYMNYTVKNATQVTISARGAAVAALLGITTNTARTHTAQLCWDAIVNLVDNSLLPASGAIRFGNASRLSGQRGSGSTWMSLADASAFASSGAGVIDGDVPERREVITWSGKSGNTLEPVVRGTGGSTARRQDSGAFICDGEEICYSKKIGATQLLVARYATTPDHLRPGEATRGYRGTVIGSHAAAATVTASNLFVVATAVTLEGIVETMTGTGAGSHLKLVDGGTDWFHVEPEGGGPTTPVFRRLRVETGRNFLFGSNAITFPVTDDLVVTLSSCGDLFNLQGQNEKLDQRGRVVLSSARYFAHVGDAATGLTGVGGYIDKSTFRRPHATSVRSLLRIGHLTNDVRVEDPVVISPREHGVIVDNGGIALEIVNLNVENGATLGKRNRTTLSGAIAASSAGPFPVVNIAASVQAGTTLATLVASGTAMAGARDGSADLVLAAALPNWPTYGTVVVTDGVNVEVFHYQQKTGGNTILRGVTRARCGTTARAWSVGATVRLVYSDSSHPDEADLVTVQGVGAAGADLSSLLATMDTVAAVSTSIITANFTLADATSTAVTTPEVTNVQFDDVHFEALSAAAGGSRVKFSGGHVGIEGSGLYLRYGVKITATTVEFDHPNIVGRPVYDPNRIATWNGGSINLRRPYNPDTTYASSIGGRHVIAATLPLPIGAAPSVAGGDVFATANSGATTVTSLDDGVNGQVVKIIGADGGNTTFSDGTNLKLPGNVTLQDADVLVFTYRGGAGYWVGQVAPANSQTQRTYTVTNGTTDRTYDADSTSMDELADVLSTFIGDVKAAFPGVFG